MIVDDVVKSTRKGSALINVSGNQRMLSQSISELSSNLVSYPAERQNLRQKLLETSHLIEKAHQGLLHGDEAMGLIGNPSPRIKWMMFESPHRVNKNISDYIDAARSLAKASDNELTIANPHLHYIHVNSEALLKSLDDLTDLYQSENEAGIANLRHQQKIIMLVQVSVILLLTLLIFLPLVHRVRRELFKSVALEKQVSSIIEYMLDGLVTIDEQGIVQSFNPAAEGIFGYKAEEIIGRNVNVLMPGAHAGTLFQPAR